MPVVHHSSCFAQPSLPASFAPPSIQRWRTSRPTNVGLASRSNSQRASRPACLASPILPRTYSGRDARSRPPHPSVVLISFTSNTAGAYMARDNARRRYGAGLLDGPRARGGGGGGKCVNVAEDESGNVVVYRRTGQTCNKRECSCGKKRGNAVTENRDCKERVAVHSPASRVRARPGSRSTVRNPGCRRCGSELLALPVRVTRGPRGAGAGMPCGLRGAR